MVAPTPNPDLQPLLDELRAAEPGSDASQLLALVVRLRTMARRHLPTGSVLRASIDSEDLTQETLLDLIAALDRFEGRTWPEFLAFAKAVMEQRRARHGRRAAVRQKERAGDPDLADDLAGAGLTPSVDVAAREELQHLRGLLAELPEPYRGTLLLRFEGLDTSAIAVRLQMSEDAVRQRLSRALAMLKSKW